MILTLPDEPALASFNEAELTLELALGLFASGRVTRSVGAAIAGLSQFDFDEELFRRRIPSFSPDTLDRDLDTLASVRTA